MSGDCRDGAKKGSVPQEPLECVCETVYKIFGDPNFHFKKKIVDVKVSERPSRVIFYYVEDAVFSGIESKTIASYETAARARNTLTYCCRTPAVTYLPNCVDRLFSRN